MAWPSAMSGFALCHCVSFTGFALPLGFAQAHMSRLVPHLDMCVILVILHSLVLCSLVCPSLILRDVHTSSHNTRSFSLPTCTGVVFHIHVSNSFLITSIHIPHNTGACGEAAPQANLLASPMAASCLCFADSMKFSGELVIWPFWGTFSN